MRYGTHFPLTESPISEGSKWQLGLADGGSWQNPQTIIGRAVGTVNNADGASSGPPYDDHLAHLKKSFMTFPPNHRIRGRFYRAAGYTPSTFQESGLYFRTQISAGVARGYELNRGFDGGGNNYIEIVNWTGPLNGFSSLSGAIAVAEPLDDDWVEGEIIGSRMNVWLNDVAVPELTNFDLSVGGSIQVWAEGQPGMGFWNRAPNTPSSVGWKYWEAWGL